jgi:hypothetical protein
LKGKDKKYYLSTGVEFEVAVVNIKKGEGGFKLFVVDASGEYGKESVSKIRFKVESEDTFSSGKRGFITMGKFSTP